MTFKRLESFGHLRDVDADAGTVTAVISTGNIARDGAGIDPKGWDFENFRKNPVVLWQHDDSVMPFARATEVLAHENELVARTRFDMEDPRAQALVRKIAGGFVNATSVRWLPRKTEMRSEGKGKDEKKTLWFIDQELLEYSFVSIPADPGAMIMRADGGAFNVNEYDSSDSYVAPQPLYGPFKSGTSQLADDLWRSLGVANDENKELRSTIADLEDRLRERNGTPDNKDRAAKMLAGYLARERPDISELITTALSRVTGKTPERIRQEMAGGGN